MSISTSWRMLLWASIAFLSVPAGTVMAQQAAKPNPASSAAKPLAKPQGPAKAQQAAAEKASEIAAARAAKRQAKIDAVAARNAGKPGAKQPAQKQRLDLIKNSKANAGTNKNIKQPLPNERAPRKPVAPPLAMQKTKS